MSASSACPFRRTSLWWVLVRDRGVCGRHDGQVGLDQILRTREVQWELVTGYRRSKHMLDLQGHSLALNI